MYWHPVHLLCSSIQAVIRGVCAIIDAFHFRTSAPPSTPADSAPPTVSNMAATQTAEEVQEEVDDDAAARHDAEAASTHRDIQSALIRRVLPSLRSQLVQDGEVRLFSIVVNYLTKLDSNRMAS